MTPSYPHLRAQAEGRKARKAAKAQETAQLAILGGVPGPQTALPASNTRPMGPGRLKRATGKPGAKLKKIRKVPKATIRKRLIKALDKAFSLEIRAKWSNCPFCGGAVEHCFHFITRAKYSVRWDDRNAVGSCSGCNLRYEFDPHFAIQWYIAWKGLPAYEQLIRDGNAKDAEGKPIPPKTNEELAERLAALRATSRGAGSA